MEISVLLKKTPSYILFTCFIFICCHLSAQNEATVWYFGNQAGLNFSTSPPTVLANSSMSVQEGCAVISDGAGNLLFYSDGMTIWDKTHSIMSNGSGLAGYNTPALDGTSSQGCIILPSPSNNNTYLFLLQKHPRAALEFHIVLWI